MAELSTLQTQRDRLAEIRAKGLLSYRIGDREMRYKSDAELAAAIADLDRQIAAASGRTAVKVSYINYQKGT